MKFNPFFVRYARDNGNTPEKQLILDDLGYPGGCMCGYIIWISQKLNQFRTESPESFMGNNPKLDAWKEYLK